jgi:hypothetical protein
LVGWLFSWLAVWLFGCLAVRLFDHHLIIIKYAHTVHTHIHIHTHTHTQIARGSSGVREPTRSSHPPRVHSFTHSFNPCIYSLVHLPDSWPSIRRAWSSTS